MWYGCDNKSRVTGVVELQGILLVRVGILFSFLVFNFHFHFTKVEQHAQPKKETTKIDAVRGKQIAYAYAYTHILCMHVARCVPTDWVTHLWNMTACLLISSMAWIWLDGCPTELFCTNFLWLIPTVYCHVDIWIYETWPILLFNFVYFNCLWNGFSPPPASINPRENLNEILVSAQGQVGRINMLAMCVSVSFFNGTLTRGIC